MHGSTAEGLFRTVLPTAVIGIAQGGIIQFMLTYIELETGSPNRSACDLALR